MGAVEYRGLRDWPERMKRFFRLVRYGLPYWLQLLPGVLLLAVVGLLDNFRTLLFQPIFDKVLNPRVPDGPIVLGVANSQWHVDLRAFVPHFMHNAWTVVSYKWLRRSVTMPNPA